MSEWLVSMDAFGGWLCEREYEVVGVPGRYFDSPVARFLSETYGQVYGVDDEGMCWRACEDWRRFRLSSWVRLFLRMTEQTRAFRPVTGAEAFASLVAVEARLAGRLVLV
jgi:hypothetical protein